MPGTERLLKVKGKANVVGFGVFHRPFNKLWCAGLTPGDIFPSQPDPILPGEVGNPIKLRRVSGVIKVLRRRPCQIAMKGVVFGAQILSGA